MFSAGLAAYPTVLEEIIRHILDKINNENLNFSRDGVVNGHPQIFMDLFTHNVKRRLISNHPFRFAGHIRHNNNNLGN